MTNEPEHAAGSHPVDAAEETRGWGGAEVVRDRRDVPDSGAAGWSADEVVKDHGEVPDSGAAGWSADEVVKDHGGESAG